MYQRLFMTTLETLCLPGIKKLDTALRADVLALPALGPREEAILTVVRSLLDERLGDFEQRISNRVAVLERRVSETITRSVSHAEVDPGHVPYPTAVPPPLAKRSNRASTVREILLALQECTWLAICGHPGTGKSELAKLIVQETGRPSTWIPFSGLSPSEAALRLDLASAPPATSEGFTSCVHSITSLAERLPEQAILVLDDIPLLTGRDAFSERLLLLATGAAKRGMHVLTTSLQRPESKVGELIPQGLCLVRSSPPLTDEEAIETFLAYGAPPGEQTTAFARATNAAVRGHAFLLAASGRLYQKRGYPRAAGGILGLLGGLEAPDLRKEVLIRLLDEIGDPQTRQLLYRLNLVIGTFSFDDARLLAAVEPQVDRPAERVQELVDTCLSQEDADRFTVIPLFRILGAFDVGEPEKSTCRMRLAEQLLRKVTITPHEGLTVFSYLWNAAEYDRAGVHLVNLLFQLTSHTETRYDAIAGSIWGDQRIPGCVGSGLRIQIRCHQLRLLVRQGRPAGTVLDELRDLVAEAKAEDAIHVFSAGLLVTTLIPKISLSSAFPLFKAALSSEANARSQLGTQWPFPNVAAPAELLWTYTMRFDEGVNPKELMDAVDDLTPEQLEVFFNSDLAPVGSLQLSDSLYLREYDLPGQGRDWESVLESLRLIEAWASRHDYDLIWAGSIRTQVVIHSEIRNDLLKARSIVDACLSSAARSAAATFVIKECMGRQYLYHSDSENAREFLEAALPLADTRLPLVHVTALVHAARVAGRDRVVDAVHHIEEALEICRAESGISELYLAKVLGELAIARFQSEGVRAAYPLFLEGLQHLLASQEDDCGWTTTAVAWGHVSGYLSCLADTGEPPAGLPSGEVYAAPVPGMLFNPNPDLSSRFKPENMWVYTGQMATYASAVGDDMVAADMAARAYDAAIACGKPLGIAGIGIRQLALHVAAARYEDAIGISCDVLAAFKILERHEGNSLSLNASVQSFEDTLGARPSKEWDEVEERAIWQAVVPSLLHALTPSAGAPVLPSEALGEIADICRQIAVRASSPALWLGVVEAVDLLLDDTMTGARIVERGREWTAERQPHLATLAYVFSTLKADVGPEEAVVGHIVSAYSLSSAVGDSTPVYGKAVAPFFARYWRAVLKRERFRFTPPDQAEAELSTALLGPPATVVQRVLGVVTCRLGVRIDPDLAQWLRSCGRRSAQPLDS
jgi:hypothetical protein